MASYHNHRVIENQDTCALSGKVSWSPVKSIWFTVNFLIGTIGAVLTFSWTSFLVFLLFTAFTLCFGHSLGMHRLLIHRSYSCPKWLEYFLVHLGVIVGLAGPKGMMQTHDFRDWAQRQKGCHSYFGHKESFWKDAYWQIHCDLILEQAPQFKAEESFIKDRVYQFMELSWMLQQLPWAIILFIIGGWAWVIWGVCTRVWISITGHWLIGYFAHNEGQRHWHVEGAAIQGYNLKLASLITMGESLHNNHHAYPNSACLGLKPGELDPGWWMLKLMEKFGLASDIVTHDKLPFREELKELL